MGFRRSWAVLAAIPVALAAIAVLQPKTSPVGALFRQVTFEDDAGSPALSRDGKRVVYCSNRNLWVRKLDSTSPARRLTEGQWNDYDPEFSPDGTFVYFTSDRRPQGIYRVSAGGGAAELVRADAVTAKFSPNGRWFLFNGATGLQVMPVGGGPAHGASGGLSNCYGPVWSADSRWILFACGVRENMPEWRVAPAESGKPVATGLVAALARFGFNYVVPEAWLPGNELIFAGRKGETMTLWRIGFDPTTRTVTRDPAPATDSASGDYGATFAAGQLAFGRTQVGMNLWSLPVDRDRLVSGAPERLTFTPYQKGSRRFRAMDGFFSTARRAEAASHSSCVTSRAGRSVRWYWARSWVCYVRTAADSRTRAGRWMA